MLTDAQPARAVVKLHKDHEKDEPLDVDVDASVTCECGHTSKERGNIYLESDTLHVMCAASGAEYVVAVTTVLAFTATLVRESGSLCRDRGAAAAGPSGVGWAA